MRHVLLTLIILLTSSNALAQENKPQDQKPTEATAVATEKPKNEVEQMLEEARKRGETIVATCPVDDCDKRPVEPGVENGRVLQLPKPAYPVMARRAHVSGKVEVQVIIDEEGKVIAAAAISGHPLLYGVCVAAARDSVFTPTKLNGKSVKVIGVLQYKFTAQ